MEKPSLSKADIQLELDVSIKRLTLKLQETERKLVMTFP
jgi:hypothetical protein